MRKRQVFNNPYYRAYRIKFRKKNLPLPRYAMQAGNPPGTGVRRLQVGMGLADFKTAQRYVEVLEQKGILREISDFRSLGDFGSLSSIKQGQTVVFPIHNCYNENVVGMPRGFKITREGSWNLDRLTNAASSVRKDHTVISAPVNSNSQERN